MNSSLHKRFFLVAAAAVALLSAGCGGSFDASVYGTVSYDGKLLDRGTVTFHPASGTGAAAYGKIEPDGSFVLQTGAEEGIATGEYKVTVQSVEQIPSASPDNPPRAKPLIPGKFNMPSQSGLIRTVEAGSNEFDLELPKLSRTG